MYEAHGKGRPSQSLPFLLADIYLKTLQFCFKISSL